MSAIGQRERAYREIEGLLRELEQGLPSNGWFHDGTRVNIVEKIKLDVFPHQIQERVNAIEEIFRNGNNRTT